MKTPYQNIAITAFALGLAGTLQAVPDSSEKAGDPNLRNTVRPASQIQESKAITGTAIQNKNDAANTSDLDDSFRSIADQISKSRKEALDAVSRRDEAEKQIEMLKQQNRDLVKKFNSRQPVASTDEKSDEKRMLRQRGGDFSELRNELIETRAEIASLRKDMTSFARRDSADAGGMKGLREQLDSANAKSQKFEAEAKDFQRKYDGTAKSSKELQSRVSMAEMENQRLNREKSRLETANKALEVQINAVSDARKDLAIKQKQYAAIEKALQEREAEVADLRSKLDKKPE